MLLVSEDDVFEIPVYFVEKGGAVVFQDVPPAVEPVAQDFVLPEGAVPVEIRPAVQIETFVFRRPTWLDIKNINSSSMTIEGGAGKPSIDMFRYMDMKIKALLKEWSLKDAGGEKLPITGANINKLNPDLLPHLFTKLEEYLSGSK